MNLAIAKLLLIEHWKTKWSNVNRKQGKRVILIWLDRYYYLASIEECSDNGRFWYFLKLRYIGIAYILPSLTY